MFDRISGIYDRLNGVMTAGLHHVWRRRAVDLAGIGPGARVLDVATGTGDLAFEAAARVAPGGIVIGADFSEQMLEVARRKAGTAGRAPGAVVSFEQANALALPYPDDQFDAATVGFGVRNFSDLDQGLRELARVVRPGGKVVILEMTTPRAAPALDLLRAVVRPDRARFGSPCGRPTGVQLPAELGQTLPRTAGAGRQDGRCGPARDPLHRHGWGHHRPPCRYRRVVPHPVSTYSTATAQAVVAAGGTEAERVLLRVEQRMAALSGAHGAVLGHHAGATISAGGKRLRPLLVCLASGVPVAENDGVVRSAVAVELVHAATLVHDDVLDGAASRRGRPTVVAAAGRLMATATGDLLFSRAFAELAAGGSVQAVRILSTASSGLAAGELMQRADAWDTSVPVSRYLERCRLKTGVLFRGACELGALHGGGHVDGLGRFGESIGIAFQLLDDILDVTGPPERTGKPRGADLLDGTVTLPLIGALERDATLRELDLRTVRTPPAAAAVCERIAATGALELARERALELVAAAKAALPALPDDQRAALELVADGVVERYS